MKTFKDLLDRLYDTQGVPFVELAHAHGIQWSDDPVKNKKLAGDIVEAAMGKEPDNKPEPDLTHLGLEIKTIPVKENLVPREHTKITALNFQDVYDQEWERSTVYHKLRSILFVPVVKYELERPDHWYICAPFVWMPSTRAERELKADYDAVRALVQSGNVDAISSALPPKGQGHHLLPNTAGRDSRDTTRYVLNGEEIQTKRRAWMLRRSFVHDILLENVRYQPIAPRTAPSAASAPFPGDTAADTSR